MYDATSLLFQLGLVALVQVQLRRGATGTGRLARFFLHVEHVLLGLAIISTLTWMFARQYEDQAWFLALDAFWPLGAESWAPVTIMVAVLATAASPFVAASHLVVGYAGLGVVLLRPELTGARQLKDPLPRRAAVPCPRTTGRGTVAFRGRRRLGG